jgi:PPOX class probable F420-dependent enzyme
MDGYLTTPSALVVVCAMDPALDAALKSDKRMYVTTWSPSGKSGTVPVWFMAKDGRLYFTTLRERLKARRIRATGRVRVHLGSPDGPAIEGRAAEVSDRPDLEHEILQTYRRKYPILVPLFMGRRIRRRLQRKESVVIQITPEGS